MSTFSNISHDSRPESIGGVDVDLRPLIVAIRELTHSLKTPGALLDSGDLVIPPAQVTVNVPELKVPNISVSVPDYEQVAPIVNVHVPEMALPPAPVVQVTFPILPNYHDRIN